MYILSHSEFECKMGMFRLDTLYITASRLVYICKLEAEHSAQKTHPFISTTDTYRPYKGSTTDPTDFIW